MQASIPAARAADAAWLSAEMAAFERHYGAIETTPIRSGDPIPPASLPRYGYRSITDGPAPEKPAKAAKPVKVPKVKAQRGVLVEIIKAAQAGRAKLHPLVLEHNAKGIKIADTAREAGVSVGQIMIIRGELGLTVKRKRLAA